MVQRLPKGGSVIIDSEEERVHAYLSVVILS